MLKKTAALQIFEKKYGSIENNNGPAENAAGPYVGPPESHTLEKRRSRRIKNKK